MINNFGTTESIDPGLTLVDYTYSSSKIGSYGYN